MSVSPLVGVERSLLPNGLEILLKRDARWPIVSAHAWVKVGSIDESPPRAGLAHVLEHLVFKGTRRFSADAIARQIEARGGHMNAETSKEFTHYYIDIPASGGQTAIAILAELLYQARLTEKDWLHECPVILEEMKRRHDDPDVHLWDLFQGALYANPALVRPVIGTEQTVRAASVQDVRNFYRRHYSARRTVVSVVGDFDPAKMQRWIRQAFQGMEPGSSRTPRRLPAEEGRGLERAVRQNVRQCYVAYGFATPPGDHPDQEALDLLAVILGDGRNARLVRRLQEEKQLVYTIQTSNHTQEGPGFFGFFAECDPQKRRAYRQELGRLLDDVTQRRPATAELQRAKNMMATAWWLGWETVHNQASAIGHYALEGQLARLERYYAKLMALTADDVLRAARTVFARPMSAVWIEP